MNLLLSRLKDDKMNKGVVDELEIYGCHYKQIVIQSKKTLRIYYDH